MYTSYSPRPRRRTLRPVSTSANLVARTGTIAYSGIEKKQSDWLSLILVAKKLNLIQLPELTARSPVRGMFHKYHHRFQSPFFQIGLQWTFSIENEFESDGSRIKVMARADRKKINIY